MCCLVEWVEERSCRFNLPLELLCHPEANVLLLKAWKDFVNQRWFGWVGGMRLAPLEL